MYQLHPNCLAHFLSYETVNQQKNLSCSWISRTVSGGDPVTFSYSIFQGRKLSQLVDVTWLLAFKISSLVKMGMYARK